MVQYIVSYAKYCLSNTKRLFEYVISLVKCYRSGATGQKLNNIFAGSASIFEISCGHKNKNNKIHFGVTILKCPECKRDFAIRNI